MSLHLPTGNFRWLTHEEIERSLDDEIEDGLVLEVDLEYPECIHNRHNDYPLAPEQLTIDESMLSTFQRENFQKHQKKPAAKHTPNLKDKPKYVVHSRDLNVYMEQGMIVPMVHRVLTFKISMVEGIHRFQY